MEGDIGFSFQGSEQFAVMPTPSGIFLPKVTFGLAILYLPWFLIAMLITRITGNTMDAYSEIFAWSGYVGSLIYILIGLWFLRKSLLKFFNEWAVSFTLAALMLATNLTYYTLSWNLMSHGYLFFLFCLLIWFSIRWHETRKWSILDLIALVLGLATLIRPTELVTILFPILFGVTSFSEWKMKLFVVLNYRWKLILTFSIFILPLFLQMLYWKIYAGIWLFYSYGSNEHFFFQEPEILNVLLSFRNGLLPYSPILIFAFIGFWYLWKNKKSIFFSVFITFFVALFVISSWWCWWFGGSYGMRALVQYYAILAFPFAACVQYLFLRFNILKLTFVLLLLLCTAHNYVNIQLFKIAVLHWDSMTRKSYFMTQFKLKYTNEEIEMLRKSFKSPDYENSHHKRTGEKWYE